MGFLPKLVSFLVGTAQNFSRIANAIYIYHWKKVSKNIMRVVFVAIRMSAESPRLYLSRVAATGVSDQVKVVLELAEG